MLWFFATWGCGYFIHQSIIVYSWWSGRLYWKPVQCCSCTKCAPFRCGCYSCTANRENGYTSSQHQHPVHGPHAVPHMLELPEVIGYAFGSLFLWWAFLACEIYDYLTKAREGHLEYLKKKNRPIEEVFKELNEFIDQGSAETDKQVNEFVDKMQAKKERST